MDYQKLSKSLSLDDNFSSLYSLLTQLNLRLEQNHGNQSEKGTTSNAEGSSDTAEYPTEVDVTLALDQLIELIEKFTKEKPGAKNGKSNQNQDSSSAKIGGGTPSLACFKIISRNLVLTLQLLPSKVYDLTNKLLGGISENTSNPTQFRINTLVLIDLFLHFPTSLGSLNNFAVTQIYKFLKKQPLDDANIVFLLATICENATKLDLDDKFQQKLLKIAQKSVLVDIERDTGVEETNSSNGNTLFLKKNYFLVLQNVLILSVSTHYEHLLSASAAVSTSSSSSKLKPEALMSQQNTFQVSLLSTYEKVINYGFTNYEKEIRLVTVELVANLLINFVPTGKFNPVEYLISIQYNLPSLSNYDQQLTREVDDSHEINEEKKPRNNSIQSHDSNSAINSITNLLLSESSTIEALIMYIQLEQVQNLDYLSQNLIQIMEIILVKFGELNVTTNHIQNQQWSKVLRQWEVLINWMIKECGESCHDMLMNYVYEKFHEHNKSLDYSSGDLASSLSLLKSKKRESGIFGGFKGKSSKSKEKESKIREISPYRNSYQCYFLLRIVDQLIPLGISGIKEDEADEQSNEKTVNPTSGANDVNTDASGDLNSVSHSTSFIREILFKLIINNNPYIRTYSLKTLLVYSRHHAVEVNQLILKTFKYINSEFKNKQSSHTTSTTTSTASNLENTSAASSTRLIQYSLTLSALIKNASYSSLQTSTIIKILSFCTQNLKQQSSGDSHVKSSCWIILTALVTIYNHSEFVKLNSSQFLVFWKGLLTSQYLGGLEIDDVLDNLRIRNFSLACLLNYLNTVELTPETLKQFQLLLAKSYNYITYLENMFETVGLVTTFNNQVFNEHEYNINLVNNIQYASEKQQEIGNEKMMISLILYHKKILLQSYKIIGGYLKNDINSNMVIFLLKLLSDGKIFCRTNGTGEFVKEKGKKKGVVTVGDWDSDDWLVYEAENYEFGVCSRLDFVKVPESNVQNGEKDILYVDPFEPVGANGTNWSDYFERITFSNVTTSSTFDPNIFLIPNLESTTLVTSLIDLSIDLFQIIFPHLPLKIQMSLLEQMRNSLTNKSIDPFRLKSISINISVVIHGLSVTRNNKIKLDKQITNTLLDILSLIKSNKKLISLNCESIGNLSKDEPNIQVQKCIDEIVNTLEPIKRGEAVLKLAYIYRLTSYGFVEIYDVLKQLLNDPNPIVYHYTLESCCTIFEKITTFNHLEPMLDQIFGNYLLSDSFGYEIHSKVLIGSKCKYPSLGPMTKLLKIMISLLGPNLRESSELGIRSKIRDLILSLSVGVGAGTVTDSFEVSKHLILIFQELIIFDPNLIEGELEFISKFLNLVISKNLKLGLCSTSPTTTNTESLFPFNSSFELYKLAYSCYSELIKILSPKKVLDKDLINLLWISMNLKPCEELKETIKFWMQSTIDENNWFSTLSGIFKFSSKKLVLQFMALNYQQKLLPLLQRQKKKAAAASGGATGGVPAIFNDEESQNIVNEEATETHKNEPITWEFKLFIFELLNELLVVAARNSNVKFQLKSKILDIVNISFLGSTSPVNTIRKQGINLLDKALGLFGDIPDPLYPSVSILEQQQAQIISALMPCFLSECDADLLVETINILSKFINLPRIKFYSKQRILKTLIDLLEELSSNKFLRFDYLENLSEFNKKSIQLAILNCWAILRIDLEDEIDDGTEELSGTLKKYSKLLTSLWIVVLREFSTVKYNEPNLLEVSIYSNYWINFISVLSLEMEDPNSYVHESLGNNSEDSSNFFFILFSQCVETLVKGGQVDYGEVLHTINRLVNLSSALVTEYIFNEEIFGELVDLFDRLILIDENPEVQCQLIEILNSIFKVYVPRIDGSSASKENFEKLFEIIRVAMLPIFKILPFLRSDYVESLESISTLNHADSAPNLIILKKCFASIVEMMSKFPDTLRVDLYSCLLFMFTKIYQYGNQLLISTVLPHLKQVLTELKTGKDVDLITPFSDLVQSYYTISKGNINSVLTSMILITSGDVQLTSENNEKLGTTLIEMLEVGSNNASMAIQCIKTLIQYSTTNQVVKYLVKNLIELLVNGEGEVDSKIAMEILFTFAKHYEASNREEGASVQIFSVLVLLLLIQLLNKQLTSEYVHGKIVALAEQNPISFKTVVKNVLTSQQRVKIEQIIKSPKHTETEPEESEKDEQQIQLKTFGS